MPGRFFLTTPFADIAKFSGRTGEEIPKTKPRRNIQPGQEVIALTTDGFEPMRWGIIPVGRVNARGRPVMAGMNGTAKNAAKPLGASMAMRR